MSKNNNRSEKEVRKPVENKPEIVELSFEAMETLSGGRPAPKKWKLL